jgi:hypothetical protein
MKSSSIDMSSEVRNSGIKMVDYNRNKRISDIFNTGKENSVVYQHNMRIPKTKIIEVTEKMMDDKMMSKSPYLKSQKNEKYISPTFNSGNISPNTSIRNIKQINPISHSNSLKESCKTPSKPVDNVPEQTSLAMPSFNPEYSQNNKNNPLPRSRSANSYKSKSPFDLNVFIKYFI